MPMPPDPKIYHIVHVDRLASIVADGFLWCDAEIACRKTCGGTAIGMNGIKQRRMGLTLSSHPDLHVGECVPFYFCPRSVMLYLISQANHPGLTYRGGQGPIVHLEADLRQAIEWAETNGCRWAFTFSNAGSSYFEDYCDAARLNEIDWDAVQARNWQHSKEGKQAEFLIERRFPWQLASRIGVMSGDVASQVADAVKNAAHKPCIEVKPEWYYW